MDIFSIVKHYIDIINNVNSWLNKAADMNIVYDYVFILRIFSKVKFL